MASPLDSPRSQSPPPEDPGMESRTNSDWELLSMSQVDVSGSQNSGSSTPKVASQSTIEKPQEASRHQERGQLDDSFFNALGVEGFLQADRGARRGGGFESLLSNPQTEGAWPHLSWSQAGESGVLIAPHTVQTQNDSQLNDYPQWSKASLNEGDALGDDAEAGDSIGTGSGIGRYISQQRDVEPQAEKEEEKEGQRYADSPVSPLTVPASFGAGTSYASSLGTPPVTPPLEEHPHLGSWMGVPETVETPAKTIDAQESELDLGSKEEETKEEELPQAPLVETEEVVSQPVSSVAPVESENEEGEKEPPTALQKWFPYEAWWQKQETLRRWVKSVLSQPLTVWSLGLTTAVLGFLFLHQLWRNRDLQAQLRAGNKRLADQEETIRRLREAMSFRRRVPVLRVPVRFTATTWS
ncbi:hypothetical protein KFL_001040190 [Klebsormidium nitens]|uniref:Uncharacterized protein n=1 Tax=Klebsormidium nitens TaxID=105231 RepID=A0A1Y1I0B4_KLENI|nr:hypothetical protein KFL_001040190 [Klebsormidium nitens]|eukprot:GAQ82216.1 hypothetical protein KFL_001040190 [Klebsormidium nitens]